MSILGERIQALSRFDGALKLIATRTTTQDLLGQTPSDDVIDWNFALMCASAITPERDERAQEAVLRVAQGCIGNRSSNPEQRAAAALLLRRVGNELSLDLAERRNLISGEEWLRSATPSLYLDAAARQSELSVPSGDSRLPVNPFQHEFWEQINKDAWLSVSAPTSAGKSHIVRTWLKRTMELTEEVTAVYVAPTRALVEEVSAGLRRDLGGLAGVHTLPWDPTIGSHKRTILVMTQERLHLVLHRRPDISLDIAFIDEAQKISEGTRGILLTQVIDECVRRAPDIRLVFASPLSENPEVLLRRGMGEMMPGASAIVAETVTVNQSLIFVKQVFRKPLQYSLTLSYRGAEMSLGELALDRAPGTVGEKVPIIAAAIGGLTQGGNLVYANGPAEAEKYARIIYDQLGSDGDIDDDRIEELIDFAEGVVHQRFLLARVARRGVAFHYGDMPLVLKAKVEELFRAGVVRYLVCTSTLLEGVNLPCKNIVIRAPRKGRTPMQMGDFWNLSGRAGRWGQEFQGNIICVDVDDVKAWPVRPGARERTVITPVAQHVFNSTPDLVSYIRAGAPIGTSAGAAELESVYSWLAGRVQAGSGMDGLYGTALPADAQAAISEAVNASVDGIELDPRIIRRHAGISPMSIQRLYRAVISHGRPDLLALVPPASDEAFTEYKVALDYVAEYLGGSFQPELRRRSLARLIVHWMRGVPLRVIIDNRARYIRQQGDTVVYPKLIRKVMEDVEDIARFEAPRYLACYADVIAAAAAKLGMTMPQTDVEIDMILELGVPRMTEMSLIALGLSRASAMALSSYLLKGRMTPAECQEWLFSVDPSDLDIPKFAVREVRSVKEGFTSNAAS